MDVSMTSNLKFTVGNTKVTELLTQLVWAMQSTIQYFRLIRVACCVFSVDHDNSMFTMRALWLAYGLEGDMKGLHNNVRGVL
jgi:hypothetical protein